MKNALLYDVQGMKDQADQMDRDELLVWLRVLALRFHQLIETKIAVGAGQEIIEGLSPDDILHLPGKTFNELVDADLVLRIKEAAELAGYDSLPGMYTALRSGNPPPKHVQIAGDRFYFLRDWITDYAANKPKRGRRYPKKESDGTD